MFLEVVCVYSVSSNLKETVTSENTVMYTCLFSVASVCYVSSVFKGHSVRPKYRRALKKKKRKKTSSLSFLL